jgi:hypothetical protein
MACRWTILLRAGHRAIASAGRGQPLDSESWLPRLSSVMRTALRSGVLLQLGNSKSRIFSFALWSRDLELPMEQCNSSAISRSLVPVNFMKTKDLSATCRERLDRPM